MSAISNVTPSQTSYAVDDTPIEKSISEVAISQAMQGLVQPNSPFESIIRDVFYKLASQDEEALRLRAFAIESEQLWKKELLEKAGNEGVAAATKNRQNNLTSKFAHALETLPMITTGVAALASGGGVGLSVVAIGGIIIGTLMFLDVILDDPAKKMLANALGKGDTEKTQTWMGRILLATGITALLCSVGLGSIATGALSQGVKIAVSTAAAVSETAAHGAQIFTERRANAQNALMIEIESALHDSDKKTHADLATLKSLEKNIKELFDLFIATLKFDLDACSRIFAQ